LRLGRRFLHCSCPEDAIRYRIEYFMTRAIA
jgi:hypothetical protein